MLTYGCQIRAARSALNWSREELARRAGVHVASVRRWEDKPVARQRSDATVPARMVEALRAAGVELVAEPRPGILLAGPI